MGIMAELKMNPLSKAKKNRNNKMGKKYAVERKKEELDI